MKAAARILLLLLPLLAGPLACHGVLPMRDQWQAAVGALASGQPQLALHQFREFAQWYGKEPATREPEFRERQLRLWGLAALQAGEIAEGLPLLLEWLEQNGKEAAYHAFIRFQAALACRHLGDTAAAVEHWRIFLEDYPQLPETALVRWMWAELLLTQAKPEEARAQLEWVLEENRLPQSGVSLARAALAQICLSIGDAPAALAHLDKAGEEDPDAGSLHLWRALLAPSLVRELMEAPSGEAHRVAAWFDHPRNLRMRLQPLLEAAELEEKGVRQAVWRSHWLGQARHLANAVEAMERSQTGMDSLFKLRLHSLLKAGQVIKALHLAEFLLQSTKVYAHGIRADCYAAAIEACLKQRLWKKADGFATAFCAQHPQDPQLPDILFLKARIAAERKDYGAAVQQVEELLLTLPEHPSAMAWRMMVAGWNLESGQPEAALSRYEALLPLVRRQWLPLLDFQRARCLAKLRRDEAAISLLRDLANNGMASDTLREQAFTTWLGIHMRQMERDAFHALLDDYRQSFPDGINRLTVENLAGTYAGMEGDQERAREIFSAVSREDHPAADYAHEQLSLINRQEREYSGLRRHALAWIMQTQAAGRHIPGQAMEDCRLFQEAMQEAALGQPLLASLMEQLDNCDPAIPGIPFLGLLEGQWQDYSVMLGVAGSGFAEWLKDRSMAYKREGKGLPYSHCLLLEALRLDSQGRHDSADTHRIDVLQSVDPGILPADNLHVVAATADRYDFPGCVALLEAFLQRFPSDEQRPDALFRLARRLRRSGDMTRGRMYLEEILSQWSDAQVYPEACLFHADWCLAGGDLAEAADIAASLLEEPGLSPGLAARALLLRARIDFRLNNPERGRLACRRIMALYPAFGDITAEATILLQENEGKRDA